MKELLKRVLPFVVLLAIGFGNLTAQRTEDIPRYLTPKMDGAETIKQRYDYFNQRSNPYRTPLASDVRARAIDQVRRMERSKAADGTQEAQPQWRQIGPTTTGGRIKDILIHPDNTSVIYIAAAAGGVWKSEDAGTSWKPIFDDGNAIATGSLSFDPTDPSILYVGTGEQVTNANTYLGAGLFRTTNDGATWETVGLTSVGSISRIYAHPKNRDLLMVAAMNQNGGVYKSLDRGKTWTKLFSGQVYDMSINLKDENEWFISAQDRGILYSNDGGATWQERNNGIFGTLGRISVQQSPVDPNVLFALAEVNDLAQILQSLDRGLSWDIKYQDTRGCFFAGACVPSASQGFYDNYIQVSPHDVNMALAGGIDIWRSTSSGTSWSNMTNGYNGGTIHVDQHCARFDPKDPKIIYAGNDGGMTKSTDGGSTWFHINSGLAVTQFYDFDIDPTRKERAFGGTQDNGTLGTFGSPAWQAIAGGDGMVTIVNWSDPDIVYGNFPNGRPYKVDLRNGTIRRIESGIDLNESALWVAPMVIHPTDENIMYHGRKKVWQTFDGGAFWFEVSPPFINNVSAIGISPANGNIVMAGSNTGELMLSTEGGFEWKTLERLELSNNFITDIAWSHSNVNVAWVSYAGYGTPNLWVTRDQGRTWRAAWNGMPDVPVNDVLVYPEDDNIVFIATDVGVFATYDGGNSWAPYGKGLSRSPVTALRLSIEHGYLRAVTHGRSAWEADLVTQRPTDPVITAPTGGDIYTGTVNSMISWSGFTPPVTIEFSVNDGQTWDLVASDVVGTAMSWRVPNWPTVTARVKITSQTAPSEEVISRTFTIQTLERGGITKQSAVHWVPYGLAWDGRDGLWTSSFYGRSIYKLDANTFAVKKRIELPAGVGDSLFTDITMDRSTGTIYMHRMNDSEGNGGQVIVVDTNGAVQRTFSTWARRYPTGIEFVNGQLIVGERDGLQQLYTMDLTGQLLTQVQNPYRHNYGPRCLAWDDVGRLFQTCTTFPTSGGALTECYVITMDVSNLSQETARLPMIGPNGLINARGIEYDRRDKNFWISDFGGNIYKITGFDFVAPPVSSVEERDPFAREELRVIPNPASTVVMVTLGASGVDREVTIMIVNDLGQPVTSTFQGVQDAGTDLSRRFSVEGLAQGSYRIVATSNGVVVSSSLLIITH